MNIRTLDNGTHVLTLPCGRAFSGLCLDEVIEFAIIGALLAVLTVLLMPTFEERQAQYERVTSDATINSLSCDKAVCNNFDYTKGVN